MYERALDVDHRNVTLWLRYAEMEMRNRQVSQCLIKFDCTMYTEICFFKFISGYRLIMQEICGIGPSLLCQESVSFGTNILTWRKCSATLLVIYLHNRLKSANIF